MLFYKPFKAVIICDSKQYSYFHSREEAVKWLEEYKSVLTGIGKVKIIEIKEVCHA